MEQVTEKGEFVTRSAFLRSMGVAFKHLTTEHLSPLKARVKTVEERGTIPAEVATRLSAVETRTGALSMLLGRGADAERIAALDDLLQRVKHLNDLEARIKSLESRPTLIYRGVWTEGEPYQEGDFVTDHGSVWHCNAATTEERPGNGGAWQLAVKRGRDAR